MYSLKNLHILGYTHQILKELEEQSAIEGHSFLNQNEASFRE